MLKTRSFYLTVLAMSAIIMIPAMMFQMRSEKKVFMEDPLLFFGVSLIGAFLCSFVIHKISKL